MHRLKQVIHEIHRRSLWQVLGIYLLSSWAVLQVADTLASALGLPDWFASLALGLLVVGLPIVLATAFVQEGAGPEGVEGEALGSAGASGEARSSAGASAVEPAETASRSVAPVNLAQGTGSLDRPSTRPSAVRRLLTWRNAILGGVLAFAGLGVLVTAYWVMWASGIGPVGNLVAQGVLEDGGRVVLATFDDRTGQDLGNVVTEALRIDLQQGSVLNLVDAPDIAPALDRMEVPAGTPLSADLARELAIREGIPAVLDGAVASVGSGYILTATLRAAENGRSLANFRVTADGQDQVIGAIERLSRDIRNKSGETLTSIRAGKPLAQVTTSSLEALQLYTEAVQAFDRDNDRVRSAALLEQALARDSTFAMAWRQLAFAIQANRNPTRSREAISRAFQYRDRLQELERYLVEAVYHGTITGDRTGVIAANQNALRLEPDHPSALNNLALQYMRLGDYDRAEELLRRAVGGPGRSSTAYGNLIATLISLGRIDEAGDVLLEFEAAYPDLLTLGDWRFQVAFMGGDPEAAAEHVASRVEDPGLSGSIRSAAAARLARLAYWSGRLAEGRELSLRSERLAAAVSPAFAWSRRISTAYEEVMVGNAGWAAEHLRSALEDGIVEALAPLERSHGQVAVTLIVAGDAQAAESVIRGWPAEVPAEITTANVAAEMERAALYARVAGGDTAGVAEAHEALMADWGCDACWLMERAWLHERLGDPESAAALYERLLSGGQSGWTLNIGERLHARLRLGPLYEQVGDTTRAIEAYRRMADQWADGDAGAQRTVRQVRERIAALGG